MSEFDAIMGLVIGVFAIGALAIALALGVGIAIGRDGQK